MVSNNNLTRQDESRFAGKCIADTTSQAERFQKRVFTAATISTAGLWRGNCYKNSDWAGEGEVVFTKESQLMVLFLASIRMFRTFMEERQQLPASCTRDARTNSSWQPAGVVTLK